MTQCQNCLTSFQGSYCPHCGQRDLDLSRSIIKLIAELLKETFEVDGRVIRTIRALFRQPGVLTSEFLAGRRRSYTSPVRLYLVISVVFFVLMAWFAGRGLLLITDLNSVEEAADQARFVADKLPRLMFVLLPVFALMLKLLFRSRNYFDHIIFSIHLHSAFYIVLALMLPLERVAEEHWLPLVAQIFLLVYILSYTTLPIRRVYQVSRNMAIVKTLAVVMVYMTVLTIVFELTSQFRMPFE